MDSFNKKVCDVTGYFMKRKFVYILVKKVIRVIMIHYLLALMVT
jgi:hypothetical protein